MSKVTILVGLPGSGKTYYGKNLAKSKPNSILIDDPKALDSIFNALVSYENVIIADPNLCRPEYRNTAEKILSPNITWVFWENNPKKAWENVKNRDERIISESYVKMLSKVYKPPWVNFPVFND